MTQPHGEPAAGHGADAGHGGHGDEAFNAGEMIVEHIANSPIDHPLVHLSPLFGIDFSITKHVLMLWLVAATVFTLVTVTVRRYLRQERLVPGGFMTVLEFMVEFIRDSIVVPNVGERYARRWAPLILTFFIFILLANLVGLIPMFEVLGLIDHYVLHTGEDSFLKQLLHGGATATANFNVTAGLAVITFLAIIIAGTTAHGFIQHWKNLVPHGLAWPIYFLLIPIELIGMFVRPFALTLRLAANMTAGHIAILALLSFVLIFAEQFQSAAAGIGIGLVVSVPMAVGIYALEIIVILVQAYVFTLLTTTFIGMAINVHH